MVSSRQVAQDSLPNKRRIAPRSIGDQRKVVSCSRQASRSVRSFRSPMSCPASKAQFAIMLRASVPARGSQSDQSPDGRHIHDVSLEAGLDHPRQERDKAVDDSPEICAEHFVPITVGGILQ